MISDQFDFGLRASEHQHYVGDKTLLIPKNDAYDPLVLTPDNQNQVLGKVVSIIRDI